MFDIMEEGGVYDIYCSHPAEGNWEAFDLLGAPMSSIFVNSQWLVPTLRNKPKASTLKHSLKFSLKSIIYN